MPEARLVVVTVGFDEKLPIRGLLKTGLKSGDAVAVVYSKSGGEFEVRKVENAVRVVKEVAGSAGVEVVDLEVSGMDFYGDVESLVKALKKRPATELVALLVGGMRLVIFEVLTAVLILRKLFSVKVRVHLMREDGLYEVLLPAEVFHLSLPARSESLLEALAELGPSRRSELVDFVSKKAGISESGVYRLIKILARRELVEVDGDIVKLTELGKLIYEAVKKSAE